MLILSSGSIVYAAVRCARTRLQPSPPFLVSILIDSLLRASKRLGSLACSALLHFVIRSFRMPFSDSRDPRFPISMSAPGANARPHLVSLAITAGSPCGCSAAYSPSAYLKLTLFHFRSLACSACIFLSIGRLRADRCSPWEIGAP